MELSGFFSAQLVFEKKTKDGQCPRSGSCLEAETQFEAWEQSDLLAERCLAPHCGRWRNLAAPVHLASAAHLAIHLDNLKEGGARFAYPDALTPQEWAVIEALQMTRHKDAADTREEQAEQVKAKQEETQAMAWLTKARGT